VRRRFSRATSVCWRRAYPDRLDHPADQSHVQVPAELLDAAIGGRAADCPADVDYTRGLKLGKWIQNIFTSTKTLSLIALILIGLFFGETPKPSRPTSPISGRPEA